MKNFIPLRIQWLQFFNNPRKPQKTVIYTLRMYLYNQNFFSALKESGYESDSTLVFRRREDSSPLALSPIEQRLAYKTIQKGGDVPLQGLRKPAPERPKGE